MNWRCRCGGHQWTARSHETSPPRALGEDRAGETSHLRRGRGGPTEWQPSYQLYHSVGKKENNSIVFKYTFKCHFQGRYESDIFVFEDLFINKPVFLQRMTNCQMKEKTADIICHVIRIKFTLLANINRILRLHLCLKNIGHANVTHVCFSILKRQFKFHFRIVLGWCQSNCGLKS